jgi:drug/metabolite transporter (DMT)-like permease
MIAHLWIILALSASVLWGLGYAVSEKVLNTGLHPSILMLTTAAITFPLFIFLAFYLDQVKPGIALINANPKLLAMMLVNAFCIVIGSYFILVAINMKNATLVNVIELTYPLFTALFAYFLLKEAQFNQWTFIGAAFVMTGIGIIAFKS